MSYKLSFNTPLELATFYKEKTKQDDGFIPWFMSIRPIGLQFSYATYSVAYNIHKKIIKNGDSFTVISGIEGAGKSTFGIKLCSVVSPHSFSNKYVCYNQEEFEDAIDFLKKGDSILLDEGGLLAFSRDYKSKGNINLVKNIMTMRQMNVNVVICIPDYNYLDKYLRGQRIDYFFYVYTKTIKQKNLLNGEITHSKNNRGYAIGFNDNGFGYVSGILKKKYNNNIKIIPELKSKKVINGNISWWEYFNAKFPNIHNLSEKSYVDVKLQRFRDYNQRLKDEKLLKAQRNAVRMAKLEDEMKRYGIS
jgi:hypothetical protein